MSNLRSCWKRTSRRVGLLSRHGGLLVAGVGLLVLAGCAHSSAPASSRGHSAPAGVLPHFSDWRAAYLAPDGRAHVVSLDGKVDLAGPTLPDLTSYGLIIASAGVATDGKTLAYAAPELDLVDLTGQTSPRSVQVQGAFNQLMWSPDDSKLYSYVGGGNFFYVTLATGQATSVTPVQGIVGEEGWIDNAHLAALSYQGAKFESDAEGDQAATSAMLDALDVTTDRIRSIATIQGAGPVYHFTISPDRSQAFYYDGAERDFPFAPQAALINLTTGNVTPLPTIAETTGANFTSVAWRPDTGMLAVSTGFTENGDLKTWLLDVGADSASQIAPKGYPMGWAPNNGPLVLSSGWESAIGQGPYSLTAVTCASGASCAGTTLTESAVNFTFLGFVRNP